MREKGRWGPMPLARQGGFELCFLEGVDYAGQLGHIAVLLEERKLADRILNERIREVNLGQMRAMRWMAMGGTIG